MAWETDGVALAEGDTLWLPVDDDEAVRAWLPDSVGLDEDCCVGVGLPDRLAVCT